MSNDFPETLGRLYDVLLPPGRDVPISTLYGALFPGQKSPHPQQAIGPYITRLNRRLRQRGKKVEPGVARRTYRIVAL